MSTKRVPPNRIAKLRQISKLSYADLAVLCGVTEMTIRRWERGEHPIPDTQKFKLADRFKVSIAFMMGWEDTDSTDGNGHNGRDAAVA